MTYHKPEITSLGDASQAIQITGRKDSNQFDAGLQNVNPAYDLDE